MAKGLEVQKMFNAIAERYDLMNRVITLGQDQKWRKFVVSKAGDFSGGTVLDLATGTGDIAALMHSKYSDAQVIGGDFSPNMLQEAAKRFSDKNIEWENCDANSLPFPDNTFDAVTFGYLLRNVENVSGVLEEIYRVLKPGGRVICLDTTPPEKNFLYPFVRGYFRFGIPLLGKMIASDEAAYAYLTGSTMDFYAAEELKDLFQKASFVNVEYQKFMFGTIAVHWGVK